MAFEEEHADVVNHQADHHADAGHDEDEPPCPGDGTCLSSYGPCAHNCEENEAFRCPNFVVCGNIGNPDIFECDGGRCRDCNLKIGEDMDIQKAEEGGSLECPVCYESVAALVKLPQCQHRFCGPCVNNLFQLNGCCTVAQNHAHLNGFPRTRRSEPGSEDKGCPMCRAHTPHPFRQYHARNYHS